MYRAQSTRFTANLLASTGKGDPEPAFKSAAGLLRELATPFWLAVTLVEQGEWLADMGQGEAAAPFLAEARTIFEGLRAKPWLERVDAALPTAAAATS